MIKMKKIDPDKNDIDVSITGTPIMDCAKIT